MKWNLYRISIIHDYYCDLIMNNISIQILKFGPSCVVIIVILVYLANENENGLITLRYKKHLENDVEKKTFREKIRMGKLLSFLFIGRPKNLHPGD